MMVYICTKFHEKADSIFIGKIRKEHNSVENVGRVTFFSLSTSSADDLYFHKVS